MQKLVFALVFKRFLAKIPKAVSVFLLGRMQEVFVFQRFYRFLVNRKVSKAVKVFFLAARRNNCFPIAFEGPWLTFREPYDHFPLAGCKKASLLQGF